MFRALAFAAVLFASTVAVGGLVSPAHDLTENAAAECGHVSLHDDPCPPSLGCIIAKQVHRATGAEPVCTM